MTTPSESVPASTTPAHAPSPQNAAMGGISGENLSGSVVVSTTPAYAPIPQNAVMGGTFVGNLLTLPYNPPTFADRHDTFGPLVDTDPPAVPNQTRFPYRPRPSRAPINAIAHYARGFRLGIHHHMIDLAYSIATYTPWSLEHANQIYGAYLLVVTSLETQYDARIAQIVANPGCNASRGLQEVERFRLPGGPQCWEELFWEIGFRVSYLRGDARILGRLARISFEEHL